MKIAYLNPWSSAAENQCYGFLAIAARRNGLELIDCRDENDLEPSRAESVISHTSCVPKICDYPTYLIVHEPPIRIWFVPPGRTIKASGETHPVSYRSMLSATAVRRAYSMRSKIVPPFTKVTLVSLE